MKLHFNNKYIIGVSSLLLAAIVTFFTLQLSLPNMIVHADESNPYEKLESWEVSTPEEASQIAGFSVATLSNIPGDIPKRPNYYVYEVRKGAWEIAQRWGKPGKGPNLGLIQTRYGNMSGEELTAFTYKNVSGVRFYIPETDGKPGRIDLFWRDRDIGYYLYANLTGSLDESTIMEIANSLIAE